MDGRGAHHIQPRNNIFYKFMTMIGALLLLQLLIFLPPIVSVETLNDAEIVPIVEKAIPLLGPMEGIGQSNVGGGRPSPSLSLSSEDLSASSSALRMGQRRRRLSSVGKWIILKLAVIRRMLKTNQQMERVLKVLMYLSRIEPEGGPVLIGMRTLREISRNSFIVEKLMEYSAKQIGMDELEDMDGADTLLIKFSADGIFPIYTGGGGERANEWGGGTYNYGIGGNGGGGGEKAPKETEEVAILLEEIVHAVRGDNGGSRAFHLVFEDALARLGQIDWLNRGMAGRLTNWNAKWSAINEGIRARSVAEEWRGLAMWLFSPLHLEQLLEVLLYFTNLSSALELPRTVLTMLGVDELVGGWMDRVGAKLEAKWGQRSRAVRIMAKYVLREDGIVYLFLHQGQPSSEKETEENVPKVRMSEQEAVHLLKKVTDAVVEQRGKTKGHMVEKALAKLRNWNHKFVDEAKRKWDRLKRVDMDYFKRDLIGTNLHKWATPDRVHELMKVIFGLTKLNGPIMVASVVVQMLGLEGKIFGWLDEKAMKFLQSNTLKDKLGFKQYLVRFMVGECKMKKNRGGGEGGGDELERIAEERNTNLEEGHDEMGKIGGRMKREDEKMKMEEGKMKRKEEGKMKRKEEGKMKRKEEGKMKMEEGKMKRKEEGKMKMEEGKMKMEEEEWEDGKNRGKESKAMVVVYQRDCDQHRYGLVKQIVHNGGPDGGGAWTILEDLHAGYDLLKGAIQTMRGNPKWQLDELVKITQRESRLQQTHAQVGEIVTSCLWFGCVPVIVPRWRKLQNDWNRVELEELRHRDHISEFLREQKQWKKAVDEKKRREGKKAEKEEGEGDGEEEKEGGEGRKRSSKLDGKRKLWEMDQLEEGEGVEGEGEEAGRKRRMSSASGHLEG